MSRPGGLTLEVKDRLDRAEVLDVFDLVDVATRHDGMTPLSEHVVLHLRHGGDHDVRHVLAHDASGLLAGYGHLDVTDVVEGPSAETVVLPSERRHGVGRALVASLLDVAAINAPGGGLRLWAHGDTDAAHQLAQAMGFTRSRVLWQMRRSLMTPLPEVSLPAGVQLRSFLPGIDDAEWLAVNAAAFADLPDQGGWTEADLSGRLAENWFDPAGFLVATDAGGRMVGFHWTKVHGGDHGAAHRHGGDHGAAHRHGGDHGAAHRHGGDDEHDHEHDHGHAQDAVPDTLHADGVPHVHGHGHERLGEVYVVGVAPDQQGTGLGRALVLAGLQHLAALGLPQAMLYVDAANEPAIRLYSSLGFTHWDTDVLYRHA